ncbi:heme biosynthesis protein HemY [Pseudoruegeria sp. SHC-113]|uniref:heme biosynthesis protein HemY n=1 Tax=Pseudoruegeria sp. SHC-113 TaxID=2855439 RepID=UPI0021BB0E7D|nr:heme biosynthesis HemY N-terminal domain-containing protein [Pseudoruegeria sp. SHC-113]MCT8158619.1 heme biosynthesis protein HemY [Pseudoruegeria sp. SHC-113]
MLWSLLKILVFVTLVAALTYGAGFLMESDEGLRLAVAGTEFTLGPLQAVIGIIALFALVWIALKLAGLLVACLRFLTGDETALSRYFDRSRERKGYQALSDAMLALASGEARLAGVRAAKAEKYLGKPELTNLISAQAAEMNGDTRKAQEIYKKLLQHDASRFVGVRGLMRQRLEAGDTETALKLAEKALAIKPKHVDTQDTVLKLQAEASDWEGARKTLSTKLRYGAIPRDLHKRRDAVLALSEAMEAERDGNTEAAQAKALEANRLSPELIPAAVLAAKADIAQGKPRPAAKLIKKAWTAQPHPDLAAAFAAIVPDEAPEARIKRFAPLTGLKPDHAETKMLLAELYIGAEDFPAARKALGDLAETDPTVRSLTLMAAIERGEGGEDSAVRGWLTKALSASRGPQWVCESCGNPHTEWTPVCLHCGSFDTLSWKVPAAKSAAMPASTEMLPLIVGAIEKAEPEEAEAEEAEAPEAEAQPAEPAAVVVNGEAKAEADPAEENPPGGPAADYVVEAEVVEESKAEKR